MSETVSPEAFVERLLARLGTVGAGGRLLVALAGAPGSGKSTLSAMVEDKVNQTHPGAAAVVPMDGYHYDDEVLVPNGWRPRKGAPHTFDVGGLAAMLQRLKANEEETIAIPRFDRDLEIARAGARLIPQLVRLILVEGNYLLLDMPPWDSLAGHFHVTAMIAVEEAELRRRLAARWDGYGLDAAAITAKLEENDLPNGRLVVHKSRQAHMTIV
ncbi:MAG: nucleoside/nucleotide kinase family protein [Pseudomonadota bacterium]